MEKPYTSKEAKTLIKEYQELASGLFNTLENDKTIKSKIKEFANTYITDIKKSKEEMSHQSPCFYLNNLTLEDSHNLKSMLVNKCRHNDVLNQTNKQINYYNAEIVPEIENLRKKSNSLQWLFSGDEDKERAINSYERLLELKNSDFMQKSSQLNKASNQLTKNPNSADYLNDFNNNRKMCLDELFNICGNDIGKGLSIPAFNNVIFKTDKFLRKIGLARETIDDDKEEIKEIANKTVMAEVLSILKNVPIEEINNEKKGFRIKALRDAGYDSIADLYAANVWHLSSVYGISEDAAYSIKRIVDKLVQNTIPSTKIRLSADNRDKEKTLLINEIANYRKHKQLIDEINSLLKPEEDTIVKNVNTINRVNNPLLWLFLSDSQQEAINKASSFIDSYIDGEKAVDVLDVVDRVDSVSVTENEAWDDFSKNPIVYTNIIEDIIPDILGNNDSLYGLPEELAREIQDECFFPDGLLCTLRRYQEWGVKYILHQEKVLLGDEMGLGKTVQAIASMVSLKNTGATHFMVICPASVLINWCKEIQIHSKLRVVRIYGQGRQNVFNYWLKNGGVAVTTYETTGHLQMEDGFRFSMLVVDEAHYVKNTETRRAQNTMEIGKHADRILYMTGTALENRVDEMISLIRQLRPNLARSLSGMSYMSTAPQFRLNVAPVYYRRKREDVLKELPELIENDEWCIMTPEEEKEYEKNIMNKSYADIRRVSWNVEDLSRSSKANRLKEIIADAEDDGRKILVFTFFLDTARKIRYMLGDRCVDPINGSVRPQRRQEIIDEFEKAPAGSVLVAQIQAGGTGLNIQSASVVIICEPQLKPSIENQAISRAYRMGQSRNVQVFHLLCEDSIDEKIHDMLEEKQKIFDAFADKSVAAQTQMKTDVEVDEKSFGKMIEEEIERINNKKEESLVRTAEESNA